MLHNYRKLLYTIITNVAVATAAQFLSAPHAHAGAGDLFATDPAAHSVIVYGLDGTMRTFATGLGSPQGLAFDKYGNLFVTDETTGDVYEFKADATKSTFATGLNMPIGATFDGLALDVAENGANRIVHILPDGTTKTTFYSVTAPYDVEVPPLPAASPTPDPTLPNDFIVNSTGLTEIDGDGTTHSYSIAGSRGVAADANLNAYVSTTAGTIVKVAPTGAMTTFASGLDTPEGMAFRPKRYNNTDAGVGNLFVAETLKNQISEYTLTGTKSTFATGGQPKYLAFELILPAKLLNISTRLDVGTGDNVLIAGFIVTGTAPKQVILRGLGPSLGEGTTPVSGALQNPVLELHYPGGTVRVNDDWMQNSTADQATIKSNGLAPKDPTESALVVTLNPGAYTAILRGKDNTTGVGMVEAFDIDKTADSEMANISTRGLVSDGDDVMIGGFIIDPSQSAARVLIRGLGPSLANANPPVPNPLADPYLELHDVNGMLINSNDNWQDTAKGEIAATGIAPSKLVESAILANLRSGNYTAIVKGAKGGTGVALVEVYHLP